jgi:hypothetical protein
MIEQHTVEQITHAPIAERLQLIEVILQSLKHDMSPVTAIKTEKTAGPDQLLGLFADEPELIEQIAESAMKARERDSPWVT